MRVWAPTILAFSSVGALLALGCGPSHRDGLPTPHPLFGAEAKSFLAAPSTIEVRASQNRTPDQKALSLLAKRLEERSGYAPTLVLDLPASFGLASWNRGDLDAFEQRYKSVGGPRVLFVAWLGGISSLGPEILGEAFSPHSIAVYPDSRADEVPEALVHELGHVLGLVRTPRMDRVNPFHDADPLCVMFFRTVGATDFCSACKGDIEVTKAGP